MKCRLCTWICDRLCPPGSERIQLHQVSLEWEEEFASDWEPGEDSQNVRDQILEANRLADREPAAALAIFLELADKGSAYSMLRAGWHYEVGCGTERNVELAEEYYRRAICAGSWRATIGHARLLFQRDADGWQSRLEDGAEKGFVPAHFWLARYRLERSWNKETAREVRPLLETAGAAGHPGARAMLAGYMLMGMFGLRGIPGGLRMFRELLRAR